MLRLSTNVAWLAGWVGTLALSTAIAGCAMPSSSLMGVGGARSSMSDPSKSVFAPPPPLPAATRAPVVVVKDGDTISELSRQHKVSIMAIMSENRLKDPNIFPGMVLRMPKP